MTLAELLAPVIVVAATVVLASCAQRGFYATPPMAGSR